MPIAWKNNKVFCTDNNCEELGTFIAKLLKLYKSGSTIALVHVQKPNLQFRNLKCIIY